MSSAPSRRATGSKAPTRCASTTCSSTARSGSRSPCTPTSCRSSKGCSTPVASCRRLSSINIGAGEIAQPIHADDQLIPIPKPHPPTVCNSMWAITDFTEANGATRIMPGTHLYDHSPRYGKPYDSIAAEMAKGSVLMWHGSLWHGGGANTTQRAAHRHRDELLRRIHPAAGEPATGLPPSLVKTLRAAPAAARRLRHLHRPHRPHRQAVAGQGACSARTANKCCGTSSDERRGGLESRGSVRRRRARRGLLRRRAREEDAGLDPILIIHGYPSCSYDWAGVPARRSRRGAASC